MKVNWNAEIQNLQEKARRLLHLGEKDGYVYADELTLLNREVDSLIQLLWNLKLRTSEEEGTLCVALLMGFNGCMYANPANEKKRKTVVDRALRLIDKLEPSFLKCQLLVYCYGEIYEEDLAQEAHNIMQDWNDRPLSPEETELKETLHIFEENPYPHWEIAG